MKVTLGGYFISKTRTKFGIKEQIKMGFIFILEVWKHAASNAVSIRCNELKNKYVFICIGFLFLIWGIIVIMANKPYFTPAFYHNDMGVNFTEARWFLGPFFFILGPYIHIMSLKALKPLHLCLNPVFMMMNVIKYKAHIYDKFQTIFLSLL